MDSNVSLNLKLWKSKELGTLLGLEHFGGRGHVGTPRWD